MLIKRRIKNQLDATYYFIVLLIDSTCFGHCYAHHQELATIMLITTRYQLQQSEKELHTEHTLLRTIILH